MKEQIAGQFVATRVGQCGDGSGGRYGSIGLEDAMRCAGVESRSAATFGITTSGESRSLESA